MTRFAFLCFGLCFTEISLSQNRETTSQIVVVTTPDWKSGTGVLNAFEFDGKAWTRSFRSIPVTVGRNGLGWGVGMHPSNLAGPQKNEGDKRAPAGIFPLEFAFGTGPLRSPKFTYRQTSETDFWVDDPRSKHYNQFVSVRDPSVKEDWDSAETLKRKDGLYEYVISVGHNRNPIIPGRGSAIFIHSWYGPGRSTIGCTAMKKETVKELIGWLDSSKAPLLIQAPVGELDHLPMPEAVKQMMSEAR